MGSQLSSEDRVVGPENLPHKTVLQDRDFANANNPPMAKGDSQEGLCIPLMDVLLCFSPIEEPVKHLMTNCGTC